MEIRNKFYQDTKNDLTSIIKSQFLIIYIFAFIWTSGLGIAYFWNFSLLWILGVLIMRIAIYVINEIFVDYQNTTRPKIQKKPIRLAISLVLLALFFYLSKDISVSVFLSLFALNIIWKIDNRVAAVCALANLLLIIIFLMIGFEDKAEILAIWLYYFLVISVIAWLTNIESDNNTNITDQLS